MTGARILVVEDETIVAMDIQKTLRKLGYETTRASCGEEALERVRELPPDLVLMDIRLGGAIDGIQAAEQVRRTTGLPVVYLTANADEETVERAKRTEPMGYLVKPFRENELRSTIEIALFRGANERRLKQQESLSHVLLECTGEGIAIAGLDGRLTFLNAVALKLAGSAVEAAVGREAGEVFRCLDENKRSALAAVLREVIAGKTSAELAKQRLLFRAEGGEEYSLHSIAPMADHTEQVNGAVLVFRRLNGHARIAEPSAPAASPLVVGQPNGAEGTCPQVDSLTGLPARPEAEAELAAAFRHGKNL